MYMNKQTGHVTIFNTCHPQHASGATPTNHVPPKKDQLYFSEAIYCLAKFEVTCDKNGPMLLVPWKFCQETQALVESSLT